MVRVSPSIEGETNPPDYFRFFINPESGVNLSATHLNYALNFTIQGMNPAVFDSSGHWFN
jgi:hypothetical protein